MKINKTPNNKHQRGAMLIEVLLASLVLALGGISYLKLQRMGLQSSFNDYARNQAITITQSFADNLRSNPRFIRLPDKDGEIIATEGASSTLPQTTCDGKGNTIACIQATFDYHSFLANQQMIASYNEGLSILCYLENPNQLGNMRLTMMWVDSTSADSANISAASCPATFDSEINADNLNNSVTVYAQL